MKGNSMYWKLLNSRKTKSIDEVVNILLSNRGLKTREQKEEFFNPKHPEKISLRQLGLKAREVSVAIKRIRLAIKRKETIIVYGDYDADGICATAILWEVLYSLTKNTQPYIPDRFDEGYGLNAESVQKLKIKNEKLKIIITVDNGIVAHKAVEKANELGVDVIITDHHAKEKRLPEAHSIIHTTKTSGSGIAWILRREIAKKFKIQNSKFRIANSLELAAIGTIADQLPLLGINRSFAKYGLVALSRTERPGLLALFEEAGLIGNKNLPGNIRARQVGTYEINFVIAPRINAMGRLEHGLDSLRLLCTKNKNKAKELARLLGKTNYERQRIVEEVIFHARQVASEKKWDGVIVVSHGKYHEGVIGLAAAKLVEEFGRPAIVLSQGEKYSKASARSISGFNIIEVIRETGDLIVGGGGHPMAAGFTIETEKISLFTERLGEVSSPYLTEEVLRKKLAIDLGIHFSLINNDLVSEIEKFNPTGIGNPSPIFATRGVEILDAKTVGKEGNHLKLLLRHSDRVLGAIAFGMGNFFNQITPETKLDLAYNIEKNVWNGNTSIQLKIKDLRGVRTFSSKNSV